MLRQLGRYELLSLLAKGGMGEVYLARSRGLGGFEKLVVIKKPLGDHATLIAEARLVATLQHTNIVQVYDVDTDGADVWLAMEFLHGQDLRAVMKRERVPLDQAIAITIATCAGLHHAHEKRDVDGTQLDLVHRDVSPSNIFVTFDGGVKVIDFGIAKATSLPSETQLGTIKGKPGYMSPEQCRCEPLDRRTDVFCAGIVLYELTTGRRPFAADNEYQLSRAICEDEPALPTSIDPAYPPALEAIVMKALAKDRRARHATALALHEELAKFASEQRLDTSQHALASYMARVFASELDAWKQAQSAGESLAEHVIRLTASTIPRAKPKRRIGLALAIGVAVLSIGVAGIAIATRDDAPAKAPAVTAPSPTPAPAIEARPDPPPPAPAPAVETSPPDKPKPKPARTKPKAGSGSGSAKKGPDDPI